MFRSWNAKQLEIKVKTNISLTRVRHVLNPLNPLEWASSSCDLNSMKTLTLLTHSSCLTLYHPLRYSYDMLMLPLHWKRASSLSAQAQSGDPSGHLTCFCHVGGTPPGSAAGVASPVAWWRESIPTAGSPVDLFGSAPTNVTRLLLICNKPKFHLLMHK